MRRNNPMKNPEVARKNADIRRGITFSEEAIANMKIANKKYVEDHPEALARLRAQGYKKGVIPHNKKFTINKEHTDETKNAQNQKIEESIGAVCSIDNPDCEACGS
jgi:hypothetical protein